MAQLNLNLTPEFEKDLASIMKSRRIKQKSEAIRLAVREVARADKKRRDFSALLGALLTAPENPAPRFRDHDALWKHK